jgi:hypothetical protein
MALLGGAAAASAWPRASAHAQRGATGAWLYPDEHGPGSFRWSSGSQWVETTLSGDVFLFEQRTRRADAIELYDPGRRLWVRLNASFSEWRHDPDTQWTRLHSGRFVPPEEVPTLSDYRIRVAYFVPRDRQPVARYAEKIRVVMHFVSELYRQSLRGRAAAAPALPFQSARGALTVHLVRGAKPAAAYSGAPKYDVYQQLKNIFAEIPAAVGVPDKHLLIVFAETYDSGPAPFEFPGGVALGGRYSSAGGIGLFSAWVLRDDFCAPTIEAQRRMLFDATPVFGRTALGHGKINSPRFEFIEDGFGAVAHELGHALGLPHDSRQDHRDIMGNGFRNMRWNFAAQPAPDKTVFFSEENTALLLSSRYLATDLDRSDDAPPQVSLRIVGAAFDRRPASVTVAVEASDGEGLRAAVFFAKHQDSVVGGRALFGRRQAWTQHLTVEPPKSGAVAIEALITDMGGNVTRAVAQA